MLIGELAATAHLSSQAIRFYERKGLLPRAERAANGYRHYDEAAVARLRFIQAAQAAGLTLAEVASVIELRADGTSPCTHVAALIDRKLDEVRDRIRALSSLKAELEAISRRGRALDPADCADEDVCHILLRGARRAG